MPQLEKHALKLKKLAKAVEEVEAAKDVKKAENQKYQAKKAAAEALIADIEGDGHTIAQDLKDKL